MKNRAFPFFLAVLLLATSATTFGASAKTRVVHYMAAHGDPYYNFLLERKAVFEQANPDIEVEVQKYVSGNYVDQVLLYITTNVQIDVIDSTDSFMVLTATGALANLAPFISTDRSVKLSDMPSLSWDNFTQDGGIYGVPTQVFPIAAVYNKSWFAEAGLTPLAKLGEQWNWQAVSQYAAKLAKDTNSDGKIDRFGIAFSPALNRVHAAVHQAGGYLFDRYLQPTKALFDSPGVYTGLSFYVDLMTKGTASYTATPANIYKQRLAAITLNGAPSDYTSYMVGSADEYEVAPQPLGPVRRGANMYFGPLHVVKSARNVEPIWRWIKFLTFNAESQVNMMHATGRLPSYLPALTRLQQYVTPYDPKLANYMLAFRDIGVHPDNAPTYFTAANTKISSIFSSAFQRALRSEEALRTVLERIDPLIQIELDALQTAK